MILRPDFNLTDADWSKRTWDLPTDAAYWRAISMQRLRKIMTLPAWDAAPKNVRRIARDRTK